MSEELDWDRTIHSAPWSTWPAAGAGHPHPGLCATATRIPAFRPKYATRETNVSFSRHGCVIVVAAETAATHVACRCRLSHHYLVASTVTMTTRKTVTLCATLLFLIPTNKDSLLEDRRVVSCVVRRNTPLRWWSVNLLAYFCKFLRQKTRCNSHHYNTIIVHGTWHDQILTPGTFYILVVVGGRVVGGMVGYKLDITECPQNDLRVLMLNVLILSTVWIRFMHEHVLFFARGVDISWINFICVHEFLHTRPQQK